jgi:c-di-GMP-binding flagellar brake protein YcgR
LPHGRPPGRKVSALPIILIIIIIAAAAPVSFVVWRIKKRKVKKQKPDVKKGVMPFSQFQRAVVAAGFTLQETEILYDLALSANLENPTAFLMSYKSLDTVISLAIQKFAALEKNKYPAAQEFLGKLLERRKRITIQKINARKILSGSREIPSGQNVQVVLAGVGVFTTQVVPHSSYFAILSPIVRDLPVDFNWKDTKVTIFFRKINDGEYSFNTTIVQEIEDEKNGDFVLLMRHQVPLFHAQKRSSIRGVFKKQAYIYPIGDDTGKTFAESKPCTLSDISDEGCSLIMEGKVTMPRSVIIQITLGGQLISINGECRNIQYNRMKNISRLHIKAESIPRDTKNIILSVIFGIVREADDPVTVHRMPEEGHGAPRQTDEPPSGENEQRQEEPTDLPSNEPDNQSSAPPLTPASGDSVSDDH